MTAVLKAMSYVVVGFAAIFIADNLIGRLCDWWAISVMSAFKK